MFPLTKHSRVITLVIALMILAVFALARTPLRQVVAARLNASPTAERILSLAPASVRRAIKPATAQPKAATATIGTSANTMVAPVTITKDASPASGSAVGQGQVIAYTIQATNGASSDTTVSAGGFIQIVDTAPAGTLFTNATIQQQPQFGSAWSCTILGSGTSIRCVAGDGAGAGVDTFTTQEFVKIRAEVTVQPATPIGTVLTNTATYQFDNDGGGLEGTSTSNAVSHVVGLAADLGIAKSATPVVDPDGAGPLSPVALPIVGPNVPPGSVNAGGYIRYDVPFGNAGPADAVNAIITDQIPGNTAFVGAIATGGVFVPATQPPAVPFTYTVQAVDTVAPLGPNVNLTCTVIGAAGSQTIYCRPQGNTGLGAPGPYADGVLPAGYNGTLTFFVRANESITGGTIVSNPANISSGLCPNPATPGPVFPPSSCGSTADANTSNNTSLPTSTVVVASSNLSISKIVQSAVTVSSNPNQTGPIGPATPPNGAVSTGTAVIPGTYMTYRVTVTNNGPSDVSNLRVTDLLPSGLETPPGQVLGVKYIAVQPVLPSGTTFICSPPTGVNPINNPGGNGGSVVCTAPLMSANAPNNTAAIDVTVFIDPATKATLVNVATIDATLSNFNRPVSGSTALTTPVAPLSDLTLTKTANPTSVFPGTNVLYTLTVRNNGPSVAAMTNVVDTLPAGQTLVSADVSGAPGFTCSGTTTVTCSAASLGVNVTAVIKLTALVGESVVAGVYTNTATASSMSTDPTPASASATVTVVVKPTPVPGLPYPVVAEASDQKAGSILIFPIYTSNATNPSVENTKINITNVAETETACIHLFAIDGDSCSVLDVYTCLTPNQTVSFQAADFDPGASGYIMAVAVDCQTGLPKAFNCLIGDEYVKFASGHAANLGAVAVSALLVNPAGTNSNVTKATIRFDGVRYNQLPRVVSIDNIASKQQGNSTLLILDSIGGDLTVSASQLGSLFGYLYDDLENSYSFTSNQQRCQAKLLLSNNFPRIFNGFTNVIPAGSSGWMKLWLTNEAPLIGSVINFNPNTVSQSMFSQGHNLHTLTLTDTAILTVPIARPGC